MGWKLTEINGVNNDNSCAGFKMVKRSNYTNIQMAVTGAYNCVALTNETQPIQQTQPSIYDVAGECSVDKWLRNLIKTSGSVGTETM